MRCALGLCVAITGACAPTSGPKQKPPPSSSAPVTPGAPATPFPSSSAQTEPAASYETPSDAERKKLFEALTKTSWCDRDDPRGPRTFNIFGESNAWELRADGSYSYTHSDDLGPGRRDGRWTLAPSPGEWVVMLDNGARMAVAFLRDGSVRLGHAQFRRCRALPSVPYSPDLLPPVRLPEDVASIVEALTRHEWRRTNDWDIHVRPTSVRFRKDWTYVAVYRHGECQNSGTWHATAARIRAGITAGGIGYAASNPCDLRKGVNHEYIRADVPRDDQLRLNEQLYVPAPDPSKGVYLLFGREQVGLRIEYDVPIRQARLTRLKFRLSNRSDSSGVWPLIAPEPMTLQRIALNKDHVREYRQAGIVRASPGEIAGKDLGGRVLNPGETWDADLDVTFDRAGPHLIRFDVLIQGPTQTWDVRDVATVTVQE